MESTLNKCSFCGSVHLLPFGNVITRDNEYVEAFQCSECDSVGVNYNDEVDFSNLDSQVELHETQWADIPESEYFAELEAQKHFVAHIFDKIGKESLESRVLEIGAGRGVLAKALSESCAAVTAIEPSYELIKRATEVYESMPKIINSSIEEYLAENEEKFDLIVLWHVIEHINEPVKFLPSVSKLLNEDGYIIFQTPLPHREWVYAGHLSFPTNHTYKYLALKLGLQIDFLGVDYDLGFLTCFLKKTETKHEFRVENTFTQLFNHYRDEKEEMKNRNIEPKDGAEDNLVNEDNVEKTAAWFVPDILLASGGHRTILSHAQYMASQGWKITIYLESNTEQLRSETLSEFIVRVFGFTFDDVRLGWDSLDGQYLAYFATIWYSAQFVKDIADDDSKKFYFVQDFEAWFNPMGDAFLTAENSYRLGLKHITIGKWLTSKISQEFGGQSASFTFGADTNVYRRQSITRQENKVCFVYQPEKPRRCTDIGLKALALVKQYRPQTEVFLFGSGAKPRVDFEYTHLGCLTIEGCAELYNSSSVGLCISASNPSRVPFEMIACGLPVVDIFRENNLYDYDDKFVTLAEATPEAIACALIDILEDDDKKAFIHSHGEAFMESNTESMENSQFLELVENFQPVTYDKSFNDKPVLNHLNLNTATLTWNDIVLSRNKIVVLAKKIMPNYAIRVARRLYYKFIV